MPLTAGRQTTVILDAVETVRAKRGLLSTLRNQKPGMTASSIPPKARADTSTQTATAFTANEIAAYSFTRTMA